MEIIRKMKSNLTIYTSYVTPENLEYRVKELNMLPIFVLRSIRNSELIGKYSNSAVHLRNLSPSSPLFQAYRDGLLGWTEYKKRFIIELSGIRLYEVISRLESLCNISNASGVILFAYGDDPETSHRSIVAEFINSSEVLDKQITEMSHETINRRENTGGSNT